ncbi:MAG TPA: endonuclease/exonuclease/phosphatase family protein [Solirubrobacteraceae bacterium]
MRVVTWNLYHGRSRPAARRGLLAEFAAALAGWEWDVALLQEVPPWWPPALAAAAGAQQRTRLTSRNLGLPLRRAVAARNPDVLGANGGGANAILVRGEIAEHRCHRLAWWPERRWAHGVRLADGTWVVNLHATTRNEPRARRECEAAARAWAGATPLVFGGDLNIHRAPPLPGLAHVAGNHVDHLYVAGLEPRGPGEVLARGALSDHAPVAVSLAARSPAA